MLHPDDVTRAREAMETHFSEHTPYDMEYRLRTKGGEYRWIRVRGQALWDARGKPLRMSGFLDDIDKQKKAEEALRQSNAELHNSEERYRSLIENIDLGIVLIDRQHRILMVNETNAKMGERPAQELVGQECFRIFEKRETVCEHCPGVKAMATGRPAEAEAQGVRSDGSEFAVQLRAFPVRGSDGTPTGFIEVAEDITERKQTAVKLLEAKQAAEAASRAKSEFLANMSHEIRTPMTAILGFSDMLLDASLNHEALEAARTIKRNGEHLLTIINDILDLSKIEAGRQEVETTECSPHEVLMEVVSTMQVAAEAKGLALRVEGAANVPKVVRTDPRRLRQILVNLMGNAIKFTEVGSVRVIVQRDPRSPDKPALRFDVIDTGIGLSEEQLGGLFQPFYQADGSTKRRFGGTGLGLALSQRLATMLGGAITATSTLGQGSTFRLTIAIGTPDQKRARDHAPPTPEAAPARNCFACRILLAEDGPDNQRLIAHVLRKAGAEITVAQNGQIAVDLVLSAQQAGNSFDVVLMDMQMPVMDGFEATARLRSAGLRTPVIALTAHAMTEDRQRRLDAGCNDYVAKPLDVATLLAVVTRHLAEPVPSRRDV